MYLYQFQGIKNFYILSYEEFPSVNLDELKMIKFFLDKKLKIAPATRFNYDMDNDSTCMEI